MSPSESRRHRLAYVCAGACLFLVLFWGTGHASTGRVADEWPTAATAPVSQGVQHPMPKALDNMLCAQCYMAPGPGANGVGAETELRVTVARQQHATSVANATLLNDTGGWRPRLPVRIAYCRWLD